MQWVALLGRAMMSAIFIWSGIGKALAATATIAYFAKLGLPLPPVAFAVTLVVEIGVGITLLIGWQARCSALILAVWCVATALVAHFHPDDRGQMIHFMKNICMAGGFLQLFAYGAGRLSLDRR